MANKVSRWDMSRWTAGKVTVLQAIGIPWNVKFPPLKAHLASEAATAANTKDTTKTTDTVNTLNTSGTPLDTGGAQRQPVSAPASSSEADWAKAVLTALGAPPNATNINSLSAWRQRESPWNAAPPDGALFTNNPLNTTLGGFQSTGTVPNTPNVRIYPTSRDGVGATVATMLGGYPGIVSRLRSGQGLCGFTSDEFSKWSGGGYDHVC